MRLIDADALADRLDALAYDDWNQGITMSFSDALNECIEIMDDAPTVDAVEVVRCKDCKFFRRYGFRLEYADCINFDFYDTTEDGYCAWGERREDDSK